MDAEGSSTWMAVLVASAIPSMGVASAPFMLLFIAGAGAGSKDAS